MKRCCIAVLGIFLIAFSACAATKVALFFDTEDYTCDRSNDAIRDIANILKSEGVKGNFNVVGYLAARLLELERHDVIEALRHHVLGTQTLYHSLHPDIAELGDNPSYERAYRDTMAQEAKGVASQTIVSAEDLKTAAQRLDLSMFLPSASNDGTGHGKACTNAKAE